MKRLMTLMLGLSLAFGTAALFAQETPKKDDTTTTKKKKGGKKKGSEPKKEGSGSR
jgi:hypothetical protein